MYKNKEALCCLKFNPKAWDEKTFTWKEKKFIKDLVRSFFHIPLNFGAVVTKNMEILNQHHVKNSQNLMLSDESSLWKSNVWIAVDKEIAGIKTEKLSGTYLTKVFEGPYSEMGCWIKEMQAYVQSKGKNIQKMYFWYTSCPKCAKKYGKNYVVIFARI